jgi:ABC-2 type transport system ATP-binding protein
MSDTNALHIEGLEKTYPNGTVALKGIDLTVRKGDFFALLGPNGAGKSTTIGIITGLTNKTSGTVDVFGTSIDDDHDKVKSYIGLVPQEMNFNIFEKVVDIVCTQGGYYGLPRKLAAERAEKYLTALGLWEKRNDKSQTLSGGMKRRLMIVRALVHEPELLILDEPTAGVDVELRRGMYDFLRTLTKEGKTIILTTHYLEEAEELAKELAIINKGEIVAKGRVKELLANMDTAVYVLDLGKQVTEQELTTLKDFAPVLRDGDTLELTTTKTASLGVAVAKLEASGVPVTSMRPKGNRLEELFVRLTKGS